MILKLWVHRLWGPWLWLLYDSHTRFSPRSIPTIRSRPSYGCTSWVSNPNPNFSRRCSSLMSSPSLRNQNRRSTWTSKSNSLYYLPPRSFLRTMFRNLWCKPQLHTYCSRSSSSRTLWILIIFNTWRRLTKKLIWVKHQPFKLEVGGPQSPLMKCPS